MLTVSMFNELDTEQRVMIMSHHNVSENHQCIKTASTLYPADISIKHYWYSIILLPKSMFILCLVSSQAQVLLSNNISSNT